MPGYRLREPQVRVIGQTLLTSQTRNVSDCVTSWTDECGLPTPQFCRVIPLECNRYSMLIPVHRMQDSRCLFDPLSGPIDGLAHWLTRY